MQKVFLTIFALLLFCQPILAELDYVTGRHIWIWQEQQLGEAVEDGVLIFSFRIISGHEYSRFRTREGDFRIFEKHVDHYAKDGTPMPYSMFFDGRRALHGWSWDEPFPSDDVSPWVASHGCINNDHAQELFYWAPIGTPVHVRGERTGYN